MSVVIHCTVTGITSEPGTITCGTAVRSSWGTVRFMIYSLHRDSRALDLGQGEPLYEKWSMVPQTFFST